MFKGIENALNKINAPIANFAAQVSGILLLVMTVIVLLQVGCRYILNIPLSWTDEFISFFDDLYDLPLLTYRLSTRSKHRNDIRN